MPQYIPKYFKLKEIVNPKILAKYPEWKLWLLFDARLLMAYDAIREKYGPMTINIAGVLEDCGLRDIDSLTGADLSAHKFGRALDGHIISIEMAAEKYQGDARKQFKIAEYNKVRAELKKDPKFDCLNFEVNISWLHGDTFNRPSRDVNP